MRRWRRGCGRRLLDLLVGERVGHLVEVPDQGLLATLLGVADLVDPVDATGRSIAGSRAFGMLVAMMCRIRYLGGGLGRIPRSLRTRLDMPLGLVSPFISVSRACGVPIPPPPIPPMMIRSRQRLAPLRGRMRGPQLELAEQRPLRRARQVVDAVAALGGGEPLSDRGVAPKASGPPWRHESRGCPPRRRTRSPRRAAATACAACGRATSP